MYNMFYDENYVIVWDQDRNTFGAVTVVRHHLSCSSCPNSTGCGHVRIVKELETSSHLPTHAENILSSLRETPDDVTEETQNTLSWQRIPLNNIKEEGIRNTELELISKFWKNEKLILQPVSFEELRCRECGSEWSCEDPVTNEWLYKEDAKVYMDNGICEAAG